MDFIANNPSDREKMLQTLGVESVEELFSAIPPELRLPPPAEDGLSEYEGLRAIEELASLNSHHRYESYLGAGAYEHHQPAIVDAICQKSEFLTAYTPYQAEASQGMLQAIFEFQSAICALTGLEVANASLYDGASACAEAVTMALRLKKERNKVLVAATLHPHYRALVEQYLSGHNVELITIPAQGDLLDSGKVEELLDEGCAALLLQSPNFFGSLEPVAAYSALAKKKGALTLLSANPLSYGLYASAGEQGADIAIGDCQPLGLPLNFGGPYVGYIACRQELVRQMPGRLIGETVDTEGKRGFVLTLQAREQHIRRGKATSNICTNQGLAALATLVAMSWYGERGIRELALSNFQRAAYLRDGLTRIEGVRCLNSGPIFNEFTIELPLTTEELLPALRRASIAGGVPLNRFFPERSRELLIAVTETKSKEQLDRYIEMMGHLLAVQR